MQAFFCLFLVFASVFLTNGSYQETPQQALNQYIAFLNQSTDEVSYRSQQIQLYYSSIEGYKSKLGAPPQMPSSRILESYYYKKALTSVALTEAEKQRLNTSTESLWKLLTKIDETTKKLETYDRLKDYERDKFEKANALMVELQTLTSQFSQAKDAMYAQIQRVYRRYQPYRDTDAYLYAEKEMEQALTSQRKLLDTLSFYLNEKSRADWPKKLVQQSILSDQTLLTSFGKATSTIGYPASDMLNSFRTGLRAIQEVKKRAVDDYTFAAQQTAEHGNKVYRSLINQYNNDLVNWQQSFVKYSTPTRQLLEYPKLSPIFKIDPPQPAIQTIQQAQPFSDGKPLAFVIKPAAAPAQTATFQALNAYVEFINESLRQMNHLQVLVRNYQSSADRYRESAGNKRRNSLTYAHNEYKVPVSEHQLLLLNSVHIPSTYRNSINKQADVLLAMLTEMDNLSIELVDYAARGQYEQDQFRRSDAILDRYAFLFDEFDKKKEQLYQDVRRIHESYPATKPLTSWITAGRALLKIIDANKKIVFGIRAYLRGEATERPATDSLRAEARSLISSEFQNLKGLQRYGPSNGLCPYSPYEAIGTNSLRMAEMAPKIKKPAAVFATHPYEMIYYFFNNELVYQYNKFSELAKVGVLKAVTEPNVFAFRRSTPAVGQQTIPEDTIQPGPKPDSERKPIDTARLTQPTEPRQQDRTVIKHDTVYVNQVRTDTVYIGQKSQSDGSLSLAGFAPNNMVLLLDVSASMASPYKMPLLKRSIKSLLSVLRPEDQLCIVVYSGKARVVLKPTSGANVNEITHVIDQLQSDGDTDADKGLQLAYKMANKHYIRAGNNRIILATDGEFSVSDDVYDLVRKSSKDDVFLTIFTFGKSEVNGKNLIKLAQSGQGSYTHITAGNANLQLILEAQAKRVP
ncbi:VWA domain-containing protein [Spirosoma radiotolerans]|uniref:von Willebrand factor A n=1 Tax=Spirosoma radiotolerans TaxID=1379870 RepID=A0A0E3ZTH0_9BACT|nr:VWA domain-containing protein [Spirosoma radiotolerans]AKD54619.1 von Willebrand factor A [Spirosoma radiotolerans]